MQARDLRARDLFGQVKPLVEGFEAERKARQAAEAANKAKSELLATISHELRTPMEAVVAMGELLLATPLDETQQRHAETLLQSSRRLLNALNDVLDFSRVETGRFEADPVAFDLHALIHDVAAELQARANDKGFTGSIDIGTSCPRHVIADATRLRQVLMGLIDNSLKYTSIGSVRLHASAKEEDGHRRHRRRFEQGRKGSLVTALHRDQQQSRRGHRPRASDRAQARRAHRRRHRLQERGWAGQPLLFTLPAPTA